jgi:hypothetical protein
LADAIASRPDRGTATASRRHSASDWDVAKQKRETAFRDHDMPLFVLGRSLLIFLTAHAALIALALLLAG